MKYFKTELQNFSTCVEQSQFTTADGRLAECIYMIHYTDNRAPFAEQLKGLVESYRQIAESNPDMTTVAARIFASDTANQSEAINQAFAPYMFAGQVQFSIIEQPPLDGGKVAMWIYRQQIDGATLQPYGEGIYGFEHNGYKQIWSVNSGDTSIEGSHDQTYTLLDNYAAAIAQHDCTLLDDTIRTWFFVQNVDVNYHGVVEGRNDIFDREGLTVESHFISSTGIQGRASDSRSLVQMEGYSVKGLASEQIQILYAPTHLNSTQEYGVRFERGTAVHYGDRTQVHISGTASIDNHGAVVHVGDITKQTLRMWENVEVLLAEAECEFDDVAQMIVYLRDITDYEVVRAMYDERFANTPKVFVLAPVCRPTWLIEMECIAIRNNKNDNYRPF